MCTLEDVATKSSAQRQATRPIEYLTLRLGSEQFAVPTSHIQEIRGVGDIIAVPRAPRHLKGLIQVQGRPVPVLDLRLKFGSAELEYTARTHLLVLQTNHPMGGRFTVAMMVDWISGIVLLRSNAVRGGIALVNGRARILLDPDNLLTVEEAQSIEASLPGLEIGRTRAS
jgi:chemotaxis signal transduction protein